MWDSSHTHTHHTINQIGVSQSPPLKSLTSSLGPTLQASISEPTRDYRAGSDIICNDPRKSASHICAIPQKDQSLLRLLVVVNKAQIYPVNTRCGTHYTPTHITQSIKLGYHRSSDGSHLPRIDQPRLVEISQSLTKILQNLNRHCFSRFQPKPTPWLMASLGLGWVQVELKSNST